MKQTSTYFHRVAKGSDLADLKRTHQRQFPRNELATFNAKDGSLLVKVAHPLGTAQPGMTLERANLTVEIAVPMGNM